MGHESSQTRHPITIAPGAKRLDGPRPALAFDQAYAPGSGIERMRVGTPPILALAVLDAVLDAWERVAMAHVRAASVALTERFMAARQDRGFRAPDILRFGFAPLYNGETDVNRAAAAALAEVLRERAWDRMEFRERAAVT